MEKTLVENLSLEKSLALSNLSKKAYRTLAIGLLVAFSSAVLFASLVLGAGLKSGIRGLRSRLGADLLVVPEGYESGAESVLLTGEPNYFYMDRSVLDSVRRMAGIEKASPQFYLTSLS
ncbi:MAG: ABC transporter permease, partial [Treponema sp.]|nr:ABC transporter permease [Treponema sp.]